MTEESTCRHEYVKICQRKLKGLDRRMVGTRAYLPVGFKMADFKHLSPGSFVFCTGCRKRLFPKRTEAEKEAARLERKRLKEEELAKQRLEMGETLGENLLDAEKKEILATPVASSGGGLGWNMKSESNGGQNLDDDDDFDDDDEAEDSEDSDLDNSDNNEEGAPDINVDELEVESVDVEDIKAEGVKFSSDDEMDSSCDLDGDEDN